MNTLEFAMTYTLDVEGPVEPTDHSGSNPRRQWWQMTRATLDGPSIHAVSAMPGSDWFTPYPDGFGRPHVRLAFHTDDGALLLLEYTGIVQASDRFVDAVTHDHATDWSDQYMRMAMTFDTTSPQYQWLMQSLFVARGRLLAGKRIEYEVFRVT